ncbi:MAG: SLC13 family permease [Candidatus Hodarchaeales archaeon]|jgi:Na+/H+ antiporter NhaD/arsenite permease-like protein
MNPILNLLIASFFVLTLSLIIFEKTHKTLAAMLGAGLSLLVAITPGSASDDQAIIPDVEHLLELIEIDLILVIIGITLMVGVARTTGIFDYVTIVLLKKSGDNQYKLLIAFSLLTMVFSAFLDAYMAILLMGSITIVGCEALNINPKPFILAEAIFSNLGGTMTRIASPPNLIIGGHFDIDFVSFLLLTAPFVLISAAFTIIIWMFLFRKDLSKGISKLSYNEVLLIDERTVIQDPKGFKIAIIVMTLTIIGFAITSFLPFEIELGYVAMAGGFLMVGLVGTDVEKSLEKVEWPVVFFLIGLLIIVGIAEKAQLLEILILPIESLFHIDPLFGVISLQWISAFASSILDNVPVASIMTVVMDSLLLDNPELSFNTLLTTVVIGTNLGGNITPIGSASSVQAITILKRSDNLKARATFIEFMKFGIIVTTVHLLIGTIYVLLLWMLGV